MPAFSLIILMAYAGILTTVSAVIVGMTSVTISHG